MLNFDEIWLPRNLTSSLLFWNIELDALEADMGFETETDGVPSYLQPDKESDLEGELNLPSAPTGHAAVPAGRTNAQVTIVEYILDPTSWSKKSRSCSFKRTVVN